MKLDQKKAARQSIIEDKVLVRFSNPRSVLINNTVKPVKAAILEATTGFGKTLVLINLIRKMLAKRPDRTTIVLVPNKKLFDDWTRTTPIYDKQGKIVAGVGHISLHSLTNVRVFILNTYTQYANWQCDLLGIDEIHRVAQKESEYFSKAIGITDFKFGFGMSATLTLQQKKFLSDFGWDVIDTVTKEEAEREGYVVKSRVFNLGIPLDEEAEEFNRTINAQFERWFKKFNFNFDLMKACNMPDHIKAYAKINGDASYRVAPYEAKITGKEWRAYWAKATFSDPKAIQVAAAQGMLAMSKRRDMWQNYAGKIPYVLELIAQYPSLKAIIFTESVEFAEKIAKSIGKTAVVYHSKFKTLAYKEGALGREVIDGPTREQVKQLKQDGWTVIGPTARKREVFELFHSENTGVNQLVTVRGLDEGYDNPKIRLTVKVAYNSTDRQYQQRNGRGDRLDYDDYDKKTISVNFYMIGTQERRWLDTAQERDGRVINEVTSVKDIDVNEDLALYVDETAIPGVEAPNIDNTNSGGSNAGTGNGEEVKSPLPDKVPD